MIRKPPLVSIIILTYNQEETVGRAIESVMRQKTDFEFEIVVADDASTDSTRAVCEKYARGSRIVRLLPAVPNKGIVNNYFDAFEACEGLYLADCAGDDEWVDDTRLQKSIDLLCSDDTLAAVFTDVEEDCKGIRRIHSSDPLRARWMHEEKISGRELLIGVLNHTKALPFTLSAAVYRKEAVMGVYKGHPEMVRMPDCGVEDVPLIAALANWGDVKYLPLVGYRYYIDGESASNNLSAAKEYLFYARVLSGVRKLARFYGVAEKQLSDHFNDKISHIAAQARHSGDRGLLSDFRRRRAEWKLPLPWRARIHYTLSCLGLSR